MKTITSKFEIFFFRFFRNPSATAFSGFFGGAKTCAKTKSGLSTKCGSTKCGVDSILIFYEIKLESFRGLLGDFKVFDSDFVCRKKEVLFS